MDDALMKGFERYCDNLSRYGKISKSSMNKLIIASWIYDVLMYKYQCLISEDDYNILSDLYQTVEGDCLVPYQKYCKEVSVNMLPPGFNIRSTEISRYYDYDRDPRILEMNNPRIL